MDSEVELPPELWRYIFDFSGPFDVTNIQRTCRTWHALSKDLLNARRFREKTGWSWEMTALEHNRVDIIHDRRGVANWDYVLFAAAKYGVIDLIKLSKEKGATNWGRGFYYATTNGQIEAADYCLAQKKLSQNELEYAFMWTAYAGQLYVLKYYEHMFAAVESILRSIIEGAAMGGKIPVLDYCDRKSWLSATEDLINTAARHEQFDVIKHYSDRFNSSDWRNGAISAAAKGNIDIVDYCLDHYCSNRALALGEIFYTAAYCGHLNVIKKYQPSIQNTQTWMEIFINAAEGGRLNAMKYCKEFISDLTFLWRTVIPRIISAYNCNSAIGYQRLDQYMEVMKYLSQHNISTEVWSSARDMCAEGKLKEYLSQKSSGS